MARRHVGKANSRTAPVRERGRPSKAKTVVSESTLKERLAALERERDSLRAALEREASRVRKLEQVNAHVQDRISWALEALEDILETKR